MKLSKLIDPQFQSAMKKLSSQNVMLRGGVKLRFIMSSIARELSKYDEVRSKLLTELGDKSEDGSLLVDDSSNVKFSEEGLTTFAKHMETLLNSDVSIGTVSVEELGEQATLTVDELFLLEEIVTS